MNSLKIKILVNKEQLKRGKKQGERQKLKKIQILVFINIFGFDLIFQ